MLFFLFRLDRIYYSFMIMQSFFVFSSFLDNYEKLAREVFPDEETLLDISFKMLVPEVQNATPIFWKILRHAVYTPVQEARNTLKDPDPV